jgi:uncharacterized protein YgbK (DUF1537 family)
LIAFYGDDFTGASASMEATAFAGLETVLFLSPPTPERLRAFDGARVIGVAGVARAQNPEWMETNLPSVFELLAQTGAPVLHYKVCSTFDSAPHIGSIGRAIEIAQRRFHGWTPMIVADPGMGRFQAFGNLFAMMHGTAHRLDQHPIMSGHPVTPMDEADLGRHLARQTDTKIGLVDFVAMKRGDGDSCLRREIDAGAGVVSLDMLDNETLIEAGRLVWEHGATVLFGVGSQGFEAALAAYWRDAGLIAPPAVSYRAAAVERIACVSGSVSAITAAQIAFAREHGFDTIERAAEAALARIGAGRDALVYSAAGPDDPAVAALK